MRQNVYIATDTLIKLFFHHFRLSCPRLYAIDTMSTFPMKSMKMGDRLSSRWYNGEMASHTPHLHRFASSPIKVFLEKLIAASIPAFGSTILAIW